MLRDTLIHLLRDNYTEAKIRGKKSFLLERQQLYSLAEFRSQSEIVGFLADGPYSPELSKLQDGSSPDEIEGSIRTSFARTVKNLISTARGNFHQFLLEYSRRFDAYDLATLIIYKSQGRTWEEYAGTRHPLSTIREKELRRLYAVERLQDLPNMVGDETVQRRVRGVPLEEFTPDKGILIRDIFTGWGEERFYRYVGEGLSGRDRNSCTPIVGAAIDLVNMAVILRSKLIGIPNGREHLIPISWKLEKGTVETIQASEDLVQALDRIGSHGYYRRVLSASRQRYEESKSLSFIEMVSRQHLFDLSRRIFLGFPYTVGVVLAFLVLKENEAKNLAAVMSGVDAGLKPDQIRSLLVV